MRVLLIRLSAMGDVIQSLGAVAALGRARPDLDLHFVTQRPFVPLFQNWPSRITVHAHDRRGGAIGYLRTAASLRQLAPEFAIDLQGNWKSAGLARLSGAPRRIGVAASHRREPSSAMLLSETVQHVSAEHPAAAAHAVLCALAPGLEPSLPRLYATDSERASASDELRALGVDPRQPFRLFVVGAPGDPRTWPIATIARELASSKMPAVWLLGPAEAGIELPSEWVAQAAVIRHRPGEGGLRRLIGLGAVCALAGGEAIGPDQGATHVLAACGVTTTAMFGPQDPTRTAPPAAKVLVRADGPPCVPCRSRRCTWRDGPICMDFTRGEARSLEVSE